jgi:hypothetical protein
MITTMNCVSIFSVELRKRWVKTETVQGHGELEKNQSELSASSAVLFEKLIVAYVLNQSTLPRLVEVTP